MRHKRFLAAALIVSCALPAAAATRLYWFVPDGLRADPQVFDVFGWAREGKLPNIKKMMERGSWGLLEAGVSLAHAGEFLGADDQGVAGNERGLGRADARRRLSARQALGQRLLVDGEAGGADLADAGERGSRRRADLDSGLDAAGARRRLGRARALGRMGGGLSTPSTSRPARPAAPSAASPSACSISVPTLRVPSYPRLLTVGRKSSPSQAPALELAMSAYGATVIRVCFGRWFDSNLSIAKSRSL